MYANVNGTKIFFDVEGLEYVPDGPKMRQRPVCFVLHGGPGGEHANFLPDTSVLTDTMQLIYVDDRNCGRSERGDITKSSMVQNVEDLEALRKYLGLGKVFILGHSYGGMKAQQYLAKYPESLHGIMLVGTAPKYDFRNSIGSVLEQRGTKEQIELFHSEKLYRGEIGYKEYMTAMASLYHFRYNTPEEKKTAHDGLYRCIKNADVTMQQNAEGNDMNTFDFIPALQQTKLPVMVVTGKYDHITPVEEGIRIHENTPGSELHIIDDAAHEVFSDRPDAIFPLIRDFVNRNFPVQG